MITKRTIGTGNLRARVVICSLLFGLALQSGCTKKPSVANQANHRHAPDWDVLLNDGGRFTNEFGSFTLCLTNIADIRIMSGKVVACDGFVFESEPLEAEFPTGIFPVCLAVAQFTNDQRVACAAILFSTNAAVRWEFCGGYGVDSGTGCYMDVKAAKLRDKQTKLEPDSYMKVIAAMEKHRVDTWDWASIALDETTGINFVLFSSGFGDGGYNCFVGYDATGKPTRLVTDFSILSSGNPVTKD